MGGVALAFSKVFVMISASLVLLIGVGFVAIVWYALLEFLQVLKKRIWK